MTDTPGARLRMFRESAGKSRPQLAELMGCSQETVRAIEVGRRELTLQMAMRAAQSLNINDLALLYGPSVSYRVDGKPTHEAIPAVRRALLTHQLSGDPQPVRYLTSALESAWTTWHTSPKQRTEVGRILPVLIRDARITTDHVAHSVRTEDVDARRAAWRVMAEVYHLSQAWLAWHGDRELCWLSTDRGVLAAQQSDDPVARTRAAWYYAHLLSAIGQREEAVLELDAMVPLITPLMDNGDVDAAAMYVDLQMRQALTLARDGDESAWARWTEGQRAADRLLPTGYAHPFTRIGPTIVQVYAVMVAVALGHSDEAHRRAADLDPASIPSTERRARHLLELARGYAQRNEEAGAVATLAMALDASLETVMYSPMAQSLTRDLLKHSPAASRTQAEQIAQSLRVT